MVAKMVNAGAAGGAAGFGNADAAGGAAGFGGAGMSGAGMGSAAGFGGALAAQRVFRAVMDAFAHPFATRSIANGIESGLSAPEAGDAGATDAAGDASMAGDAAVPGDAGAAAIKALCRVFLDNAVSFYVHGDGRLAAEIRESTYARPSAVEDADFVVVRDADGFGLWDRVRQGTLADPHKGATVIVGVPRIAGDAGIAAEGPGIDGRQSFRVGRGVRACVERAAGLGMEYPKGFELLFVSGRGEICAVPRHVKTCGEAG